MVQKPETKTDRRVLYTKMFLRESLLELMKEKPVDKITPTELCRHAQINRNTFYSHYYTVRDLLQEIEEEFSAQIMESLMNRMSASTTLDVLQELCELFYEKKDLFQILLSPNGDAAFMERFISLGKSYIINTWEEAGVRLSEEKMDMIFSFIINGSIAILREWATSNMRETPTQVAELINCITLFGITGFKNSD